MEKNHIQKLNNLLANTYALYLKTQSYHWHVKGINFYQLHLFFENQYKSLAEAVDEIAERIVSLGGYAIATFTHLKELTTLKEANPKLPSQDMLADLLEDHRIILKQIKETLTNVSHEDEATLNLLNDRINQHEKMIWMISSSIE